MAHSASGRYSSVSIALHWIMVLLFIGIYATIELRENFERGSDIREALKMWHFMLGLSVLALVLVRIAARLLSTKPAIIPSPPAWQLALSKLVHVFLYALMIGMPIGGWLILSGEGKAVPFFGLELPPLMPPNKDLAEQIEEIHETFGKIGYFLIGLHALAALFHHYALKDNTLLRMMPGRSRL